MDGGNSLPYAATELEYMENRLGLPGIAARGMERLHALGAFQFALNSQHTFPQYLH